MWVMLYSSEEIALGTRSLDLIPTASLVMKISPNVFIDHVAMILKFEAEKNEIFFIDATSNGVSISRWSRFRLFKDSLYKQ